MKYKRYEGSFLSINGNVIRAEIWQEADTPFAKIGELIFNAEGPIVIDWDTRKKEEALCGSSCVLNIISPADRTYQDLYTTEVASIRLDIYRNGELYWSGCLDPEMYEEPYERASDYDVTLTFSDFGSLQRLKYTFTGMQSLQAILRNALERADVNYSDINQQGISSYYSPMTGPMKLTDLMVRSDNFYDEDGEAATLEEVLTGILQPLGLRMVQRKGSIYIYDLNGLYNIGIIDDVVWAGDSSTMSADVVYNNATITWSQYADAELLAEPEEIYTEPVDASKTNLKATPESSGNSRYNTIRQDATYGETGSTEPGFTIWTSANGKGATLNPSLGARFFKIAPQIEGPEDEGIALYWTAAERFNSAKRLLHYGVPKAQFPGHPNMIGNWIFRAPSFWCGPAPSGSLLLRLKMELYLSPLINPYVEAVNEAPPYDLKTVQEQWKQFGNFFYVPVVIKLTMETGFTLVWTNRAEIKKQWEKPSNLAFSAGTWVTYSESNGLPNEWGYLCYYDKDDRVESSAVGSGWATNRTAIRPWGGKLFYDMTHPADGQYIAYPPASGEITIEVRAGSWLVHDGTDTDIPSPAWRDSEVYDPYGFISGNPTYSPKFNWLFCKPPTVEVCNNSVFAMDIDTDDVEYSGELIPAAKESIDISTICGSKRGGAPAARGAYYRSQNGEQLTELIRAGRAGTVEELLIGTLYSQYGQRMTQLSGEIELHNTPLCVYHEQNQADRRFMIVGESQDLRMDISDATLVELNPDSYDAIHS